MEDRQIRRAWERFIEHGKADASVPTALLASWTRSQNHNVAADRNATTALSEGELHRRRHSQSRLMEAACPALQQAGDLLSATQSMLILADAEGAVLRTAGDPRAITRGEDIGLREGGVWSENAIGTNAIGTALVVNAPVKIHSFEHFCRPVQRWTCAAALVRDPRNGRTLGVVDLSGQPDAACLRDLAHAVSVAQQIEAILKCRLDTENASVLQHFLQRRNDWHSDGLIAVDSAGKIIHATDAARRTLQMSGSALIKEDRIALLAHTPPERWMPLLRQHLPYCELDLVTEQGQGIGAVIALPSRQRARQLEVPSPRRTATPPPGLAAIIGNSPGLRAARDRAARIATIADAPVLIEGETGVGKELFARAIHHAASADAPFVPVNCGGLPRELIGSEIFGYVRGAFTGADSNGRPGKLEAAAGGSFCLDEIGEMPMDLQPYLLRALEDGMVYRIGSPTPVQVRTRVISMTNRDLLTESEHGRFRSDLFYRIAVLRLRVPPLRERGDDIVMLVEHFARRAAERSGLPVPHFSTQALDQLRRHHWPGNVRQLRNVVEALVYLSEHHRVTLDDLPPEVMAEQPHAPSGDLRSVERDAIVGALRTCHGNLSQTARMLGIARSTLYARIQNMGIGS